jgi:aspartate/methionine/tyrosine aminotransferase
VLDALATSNSERGYPQSIGSPSLREAVAGWMDRRLGVSIDAGDVAACVGTKEFVGTLPQWLALRTPDRDTVLYPALAYPTYEMGATLASCRAVPVPVNADFTLRLDAISEADAARALCLWVNTPGNPAGQLDDLGAAAAWGRAHGVPVFSDECYVEFTWDGPKRTILQHGTEGVVAVHSLSKRSNLAGVRVGFYAGDAELVRYLSEVRKHVGMMVPGPAQAAGVAALGDDTHVDEQAARYHRRLERTAQILKAVDLDAALPQGGFYLWAEAPGGDAWGLVDRLARSAGCLTTPGDTFGPAGARYVRVAVVQPDDRIELVAQRLGV